jgi:tetratricopeptide (TPR) repeat protein
MSTSEIAKLESRWRENRQGLTFAPLAEAYRKMKEPQRALEILAEGLALHPDYIPASIVLGRCHVDLADDGAAEAAFSRVLALDGENVIALKALAEITERHLRFDEAENWLRQLLVIDRSNDEARAQLMRVEDGRRNTIGVLRDETGAAVTDAAATDTAEDDTGEMSAETSAELEFAPAAASPEPAVVEAVDAGHDFEPAEITDTARIAFDAADPAAAAESGPDRNEPSDFVATPLLEDFDAPVDMSESLIPVQQVEEFELQSSGASEFQSPDASADLADSSLLAEREPLAADEFAPDEFAADELASDEFASDELASDELASDDLVAADRAPEEPTGYEWAPMSADQETAAETWTEPATDSAGPEIEPASEAEAEAEVELELEPASLDAPVVAAEPDLVVTESMAELYLGQGHAHEALTIYRELYLRRPDDKRLRDKVTALETAQAAADPGEPELPDYSVAAGGQSVAMMFQELLAARPAPAPTWSPVPSEAGTAASAGDSAPARVSEGEPTRPADDRLSLSAVFGDDSSPVPPAVPASQVPADGMSFDAFFDAAPPAAPAPRRAAAREDDDLDQFHAWLQNLKR